MFAHYRLLIVLFFLIAPHVLFSSPERSMDYVDSLLQGKTLEQQSAILIDEIQEYNNNQLSVRLRLSKELLRLAQQLNRDTLSAKAWYELAYSYEIIGEYDLAIEACFKALEYYKKTGNQYGISMTYNELGLIYSSQSNLDDFMQSIHYFRKFLEIQQERKDTAEIAGAYSNIGLIYLFRKMGDSAYYYSRIALDLRLQINQRRTIPISYGNVGLSYYLMGERDSALHYYLITEQMYQEDGNIYGMNEVYGSLIPYYLDEGDYEKAGEYAFKRYENSKKIRSKYVSQLANYSVSEYYKAIGKYKEALEYYTQYKLYTDSMKNESARRQIANQQTLYDLDLAEQQLALVQQEAKLKQSRIQLMVVGIVSVILIALVLVVMQVRKRRKDKRIFDMEREVHQKDQQLAKFELEKSQLKEQELKKEVEYKSRQLTTHALNMMKKNQFLGDLENSLAELTKSNNSETQGEIRKLNRLIKRNTKSDNDWELFRIYFEEVNSGFYDKLNKKFPGLSNNDYKLCALIKLNMNIKESASVLNISPESVKTARYRLRKKLGVDAETDLHEFVHGLAD